MRWSRDDRSSRVDSQIPWNWQELPVDESWRRDIERRGYIEAADLDPAPAYQRRATDRPRHEAVLYSAGERDHELILKAYPPLEDDRPDHVRELSEMMKREAKLEKERRKLRRQIDKKRQATMPAGAIVGSMKEYRDRRRQRMKELQEYYEQLAWERGYLEGEADQRRRSRSCEPAQQDDSHEVSPYHIGTYKKGLY